MDENIIAIAFCIELNLITDGSCSDLLVNGTDNNNLQTEGLPATYTIVHLECNVYVIHYIAIITY